MKKLLSIQEGWTLFLDRDGVINRRIIDGYVTSWEEFEFLPGVLDAMELLAGKFRYIMVITNQQGVGKGLMTMEQVDAIHDRMCLEIEAHGGRIDCAAGEAVQNRILQTFGLQTTAFCRGRLILFPN